jgi:hypothetical protein
MISVIFIHGTGTML